MDFFRACGRELCEAFLTDCGRRYASAAFWTEFVKFLYHMPKAAQNML